MREHDTFISKGFLKSHWALDYKAFKGSDVEVDLLAKLKLWAKRADLKETSAEPAFIETFFKQIWGYEHAGQVEGDAGYNQYPKLPIDGGGPKGGKGYPDLAIGWFNREGIPDTPQIMCEFKDIKSRLDAPQNRKSSNRSPVKQCLDYINAARRGMVGNESVLPTWGIVTDMNEFRLYWFDRAPAQYLQFVIQPEDLFDGSGLLGNTEESGFERFLFYKLFHRDTLLTTGGTSRLAQLIGHHWVEEQRLEKRFYGEYREYRERLYLALVQSNPNFAGTKGRLVRLAQKILDRCIFIFFCEDMGLAIKYPPQLLRDLLVEQSKLNTYDPNGNNIWALIKDLFSAMNTGAESFAGHKINQFNGGLFAVDAELESLKIPNDLFCQKGQGHDSTSLYAYKTTLLYMSAAYNYASDMAQGLTTPKLEDGKEDDEHRKERSASSLSLYTLGRIFEQSITELEILEAEADGRVSINKLSKRKTDGVYYTPEWVVERIVDETIGGRLDQMKSDCGWPLSGLPSQKSLKDYEAQLEQIKVLDPACGSGAFLITALKYLLTEWRNVLDIREQLVKKKVKNKLSKTMIENAEDQRIRSILQKNLYGVDINSASVEITRLALWLHTARSDKPLSSLDANIRCGNSLIGSDFYKGAVTLDIYDDTEKERVNVFDWDVEFPDAYAHTDKNKNGFDAVIGNPPYVKLQHFIKANPDMAAYLKDGRPDPDGKLFKGYKSAKTGSFDLYLPFIEKGIDLLNADGRLGYIAPNVWVVNEYGKGLRGMVALNKYLYGWVDFKSHQIFKEATIYTSLQFFSKKSNQNVNIVLAANGEVPKYPWESKQSLKYENLSYGERWLLVTGKERKLINKLKKNCFTLDDKHLTEGIFQGLITSADYVYHLRRVGKNKYLRADGSGNVEVELEDDIMKPLVSGPHAKRYLKPHTDISLLFPYKIKNGKTRLISEAELNKTYPKTWKYLKSFEVELRARENSKLDVDDSWYRFGRTQNLGIQETTKLIVAQTVPNLRVCIDAQAKFYLNNVRVNGIQTRTVQCAYFLLGVLNSPVCNFVFTRTAKPKDGGWYEANKQFIAPLPIPKTTKENQKSIGAQAKALQGLHTRRRDLVNKLDHRFSNAQSELRPIDFIFPTLETKEILADKAPSNLNKLEKKRWIKKEYEANLDIKYSEITERFRSECEIKTSFDDGELVLKIDDITVLSGIFLEDDEGDFIAAQWNVFGSTFPMTPKTNGKKLCGLLRKLVVTNNKSLIKQIIAYQKQLTEAEKKIDAMEKNINADIYKLYKLTDSEIKLIEAG